MIILEWMFEKGDMVRVLDPKSNTKAKYFVGKVGKIVDSNRLDSLVEFDNGEKAYIDNDYLTLAISNVELHDDGRLTQHYIKRARNINIGSLVHFYNGEKGIVNLDSGGWTVYVGNRNIGFPHLFQGDREDSYGIVRVYDRMKGTGDITDETMRDLLWKWEGEFNDSCRS